MALAVSIACYLDYVQHKIQKKIASFPSLLFNLAVTEILRGQNSKENSKFPVNAETIEDVVLLIQNSKENSKIRTSSSTAFLAFSTAQNSKENSKLISSTTVSPQHNSVYKIQKKIASLALIVFTPPSALETKFKRK